MRFHLSIIPLTILTIATLTCGDDLTEYLKEHNLTKLLAVHLEQQLENATDENREDIAGQLANVYADLLESIDAPAARADIEQRSRSLLTVVGDEQADRLRLALLRGSYQLASTIAENHRLRLVGRDKLAEAIETLDTIVPRLVALRKDIQSEVKQADRRLSRAAGVESAVIAERSEDLSNLLSQCTFINAWAMYYQAWLKDNRSGGREAEELFAHLIDPEISHPLPEDASNDLREFDAYARTILGMALCKSFVSDEGIALQWLNLLKQPNTFEPLRKQVPAWGLAIHLENQNYRAAGEMLSRPQANGQPKPTSWIRLAAAHALEASRSDTQASELAEQAVAELAARGALGQVLDLAELYGAEALGSSGFAVLYVRGVQAYQNVQNEHTNVQPTTDPDLIRLYQNAIEQFQAAIDEPDASNFPEAAAGCQALIGWSLYYQARFEHASRAFDDAAVLQPGEAAAESLWMAIVSLDKLAGNKQRARSSPRLNELIDRFLARFPSSEHAPELIYRRIASRTDASPELVEQLLAIPPNSTVYRTARHRAAHMLYQLYRQAHGETKTNYAAQFLDIALDLIDREDAVIASAPNTEAARYLLRSRQALEVLLLPAINRPVDARRILQRLDDLAAQGVLDLSEVQTALTYRRMQESLLADDIESAELTAEKIFDEAPDSAWSRAAARTLFKHAVERWRQIDEEDGDNRTALDRVIRYGEKILIEYADDPDALQDEGVFAFAATLAEAMFTTWQRSGDLEQAGEALQLYERLLRQRPRDAGLLRSAARLAEALDQPQKALKTYRRLVAGSAVGSERWYEAKFRLISLLAKVEPARAREVIKQHRTLNPDYGPDPWGEKLRELNRKIPQPAQTGEEKTANNVGSSDE